MSVSMKWYPNSSLQIRSADSIIYIDPAKLEDPDLEKGDIILVTHHHGDHLNKSTVERLSKEHVTLIGPRKCRRKLGANMKEVQPGDKLQLGTSIINVVHAYNPPRGWRPTFHKKGECVGYVLEIDGKRIYHAGDTGLIDEMRDLGNIDIAFLPIGGLFTMNIDEAVEAVKRIRPKIVVPIHILKADPQQFKEKVGSMDGTKVMVLAPGELIQI